MSVDRIPPKEVIDEQRRTTYGKMGKSHIYTNIFLVSPNCRMKTASVSEVFWKLKLRKSLNSHRQYRSTISLKRNETS